MWEGVSAHSCSSAVRPVPFSCLVNAVMLDKVIVKFVNIRLAHSLLQNKQYHGMWKEDKWRKATLAFTCITVYERLCCIWLNTCAVRSIFLFTQNLQNYAPKVCKIPLCVGYNTCTVRQNLEIFSGFIKFTCMLYMMKYMHYQIFFMLPGFVNFVFPSF